MVVDVDGAAVRKTAVVVKLGTDHHRAFLDGHRNAKHVRILRVGCNQLVQLDPAGRGLPIDIGGATIRQA